MALGAQPRGVLKTAWGRELSPPFSVRKSVSRSRPPLRAFRISRSTVLPPANPPRSSASRCRSLLPPNSARALRCRRPPRRAGCAIVQISVRIVLRIFVENHAVNHSNHLRRRAAKIVFHAHMFGGAIEHFIARLAPRDKTAPGNYV